MIHNQLSLHYVQNDSSFFMGVPVHACTQCLWIIKNREPTFRSCIVGIHPAEAQRR